MKIYPDTVPFTILPFGCIASLRTLQSYGTEINNTMDNNTLLVAAAVCISLKRQKKPKRKWMKGWLKQRNTFTHTNLLSELSLEPTDWRNFLRMDEQTYFKLLGLVTPIIKKQDTNMRQAITAHERLCATLRFLASGTTYENLKFETAISAQCLGTIIPETCKAIITVLKSYMKVSK